MFKAKANHEKGFSLIEVLISLIIIAVGLLGLASLQMTGIRNNHSAYLRSQMTFLSYDIVDRMRANRISAEGGAYTLLMTDAAPVGASIADKDRIQWLAKVAEQLPSGDASISTSVGGSNTIVTVEIQWDSYKWNDDEDKSVADTESFVTETVL